MKSNLFIVGAAKSGTTSFHSYLNQHPSIEMSTVKETNFFSSEDVLNDDLYYNDAPLIKTIEEYNSLFFIKKNVKFYGESSVSYLFYPRVANRIKDYNDNSKVVIFLRNPIERSYSHFLMDYTAGYFSLSFKELLENPSLNEKAYQQSILQSLYFNQVKKFIDVFGLEKVKIIILEEYQFNNELIINELETFLGVFHFKNYSFTKMNSYSYSNNWIIKYFYRSQFVKRFFRKLLNKKKITLIKSIFLKSSKPNIDTDCEIFLKKLFKSDVVKLSNLLNKDLNSIWNIK